MCENQIEEYKTVLLEDLGMKFPTKTSKQKKRYGLYECQYCGKEFITTFTQIKRNPIKNCGCIPVNKTHGLTSHRLYKTWNSMLHRCYNEEDNYYHNYGGRGISICERWRSVKNFIEDMFPSFKEGLTLDRIDIDGNYEPENCRWASKLIQSRNTRKIRENNKSGFRGVSWHKEKQKYRVNIKLEKQTHLGYYHNPEQGALAYDTYVRENNLEHTKNFSDEEYYELVEKYISNGYE